jgi:predicted ribosomally synthesized peptide with SipW-like signal peptide
MMKKKSILTIVLSLVLVGVISVGATMAYLTSMTDIKVNTFTIGDVKIQLDEPKWDAKDASHNFVPGVTLPKDPTVTVKANSEDCYVFMFVDSPSKWKNFITINGMNTKIWKKVKGYTGIYLYKEAVVKQTKDSQLPALFTGVTPNVLLSHDDLAKLTKIKNFDDTIFVTAFAIQKANVDLPATVRSSIAKATEDSDEEIDIGELAKQLPADWTKPADTTTAIETAETK